MQGVSQQVILSHLQSVVNMREMSPVVRKLYKGDTSVGRSLRAFIDRVDDLTRDIRSRTVDDITSELNDVHQKLRELRSTLKPEKYKSHAEYAGAIADLETQVAASISTIRAAQDVDGAVQVEDYTKADEFITELYRAATKIDAESYGAGRGLSSAMIAGTLSALGDVAPAIAESIRKSFLRAQAGLPGGTVFVGDLAADAQAYTALMPRILVHMVPQAITGAKGKEVVSVLQKDPFVMAAAVSGRFEEVVSALISYGVIADTLNDRGTYYSALELAHKWASDDAKRIVNKVKFKKHKTWYTYGVYNWDYDVITLGLETLARRPDSGGYLAGVVNTWMHEYLHRTFALAARKDAKYHEKLVNMVNTLRSKPNKTEFEGKIVATADAMLEQYRENYGKQRYAEGTTDWLDEYAAQLLSAMFRVASKDLGLDATAQDPETLQKNYERVVAYIDSQIKGSKQLLADINRSIKATEKVLDKETELSLRDFFALSLAFAEQVDPVPAPTDELSKAQALINDVVAESMSASAPSLAQAVYDDAYTGKAAVDQLVEKMRDGRSALRPFVSWMKNTFAFTSTLIRSANNYLRGLPSKYAEYMNQITTRRAELLHEVDQLALEASVATQEELDAINQLLYDLQFANAPDDNNDLPAVAKWPFVPEWLPEEQLAKTTVDPALAERFSQLPVREEFNAQEFVKKVLRASYESHQGRINAIRNINQQALDRLLSEELITPQDAKVRIDAAEERYAQLEDRLRFPYMPLKRWGDYIVVGRSRELAELENKAAAFRRMIQDAYVRRRDIVVRMRNGELTEAEAENLLRETKYEIDAIQKRVAPIEDAIDNLKRKGNHYYVAFFETQSEAEAAREKLSADFENVLLTKRVEAGKLFERANTSSIMSAAVGLLKEELKDLDPQLQETVGSALDELVGKVEMEFGLLSPLEAQLKNRKYIAGADTNMLRAFVENMRQNASAQAHFENGGRAEFTLVSMAKLIRSGGLNSMPLDVRLNVIDTFNELLRRHALISTELTTESAVRRFSRRLLALNSMWMLLTSPIYLVQTLAQNAMMAHPYMAARFGYKEAAEALKEAHADMMAYRKDLKRQENLGEVIGMFEGALFDPALIKDKKERELIETLTNLGILDLGLNTDYGYIDGGTIPDSSDNPFATFGNKGLQKTKAVHDRVRHISRVFEIHARGAAALANYRLAYKNVTKRQIVSYQQRYKKETGSLISAEDARHQIAMDMTKEMINLTHGDYSAVNAPRMFNALQGVGNVILQYRKFMLIQITQFATAAHQALKGLTAEEREVGRREVMYIVANALALAGVHGLPAWSTLMFISSLFGGAGGPDDEMEKKLHMWLGGGDFADLIVYGLPTLLDVNLSDSIGWGQMLSIAPYARFELSQEGFNDYLIALLGPSATLMGRFAQGIGMIGDSMQAGLTNVDKLELLQGTAQLMPRGLRDVINAYIAYTEGVHTFKGTLVVPKEEISVVDAMQIAFGSQPQSVKKQRENYYFMQALQQHFSDMEAAYVRHIERAVKAGEDPRPFLEEFKALQEQKREWGLRPRPYKSLSASVRRRMKMQATRLFGLPVTRSNVGLLRKLYANENALIDQETGM